MISVLCVCSYNRTRSVLMEALLRSHLADLDVAAHVCSAGVRGSGGFVSTGVVTHLATLGLRCNPSAGTLLREAHIASADLVITAGHEHVVEIAARWPDAFRRTFTLPELLGRIRHVGGRLGGPMPDWIDLLNDGRQPGIAYLDDHTFVDIEDPTGKGRAAWPDLLQHVDVMTRRLAQALT